MSDSIKRSRQTTSRPPVATINETPEPPAEPVEEEQARPRPVRGGLRVRKNGKGEEFYEVSDEMGEYVTRRLEMTNGTTITEIGADLANRFGPDGEPRKLVIQRFVRGAMLFLVKEYGDERRDQNGHLTGYGDRVYYDHQRGHLRKTW